MTSLRLSSSSTFSPSAERLLLQLVIIIGGFLPVCFGLAGAVLGGTITGDTTGNGGDSQIRFLFGLLAGIGLAYWEAVPQIEVRTTRIRLLTCVVILGGLFRLIGIALVDGANEPSVLCLLMELAVTPLVCIWQSRIARRFSAGIEPRRF